MLRNLLFTCLISLVQPLLVSAQQFNQNVTAGNRQSVQTVKKDFTEDWLTQAQSFISASEYFFNPVAGENKYFAANKKQGTGSVISRNGFTISPVNTSEEQKDNWRVAMQLKYIGKGAGNLVDLSNGCRYSANNDKLTVTNNRFSVDYINREDGLRQNFIIDQKPGGNDNLQVKLQVTGDLKAVANNNAVQFKDASGITKLYYRDLKVWDANQQLLAANMEIHNGELEIIVDDSKATYPITIDPINQTPEWTTSANGILPTLVGQLAINAAYGFSVAGLGDVNGDGFDDVAVGAPAMVDLISGTGTLASVGAVFVYYGSANGLPVVPSAKLQPTTCVAGALFGYSIAGGDVNNDGKADIIVGAPLDNVSLSIGGGSTASGKVGKAYVFNGASLQTTTTPLLVLQLTGSGILENGINLSVKALFGFSVAVTEDLNGDGKKDIIIGAPTYAGIKAGLLGSRIVDVQSGGAFVFLSNNANNPTITKLEPIKSNLLGLGILESNINGLLFGYSVDGLGDYNGDGKPDVVATAPAGVSAGSINALLNGKLLQGSALVYYGTGAGVNTNAGATLTSASNGLLCDLTGAVANIANLFGVSVKGVKNANGVRNGNILVGAPLGNTIINVLDLKLKTGTVSVFKKKNSSPSGYVVPDQVLASPRNSNNILQLIQCNLLFGYSLDNVLDVNCDGIADIIVGEPASSGIKLLNANVAGGAAYVYLGKADGTYQAAPSWTLTAYEDEFLGINTTSLIGYSVAGAGKVKGAAFNNRILVGSPSRTLDFGAGLLNLGSTVGTLFSLVVGDNGVGKAFVFDIKQCINLSLTKTDVLCNGGNTGNITATFSEGIAPYNIKIDNGTYAAATSPASFTGLIAGAHTITVKDANGTEKTVSVTIAAPSAITATTTKIDPACPGESNGSFTITATGGTGAFTYSSNGGTTYQSSSSFSGLAAATYNWSIKDANGCTASGTIILTDPAAMVATATISNPTRFAGVDGSFTITATGGTGAITYSNNGGATFQSSATFSGLTCDTYSWIVKDANGCTKTGQVTLVCPPDITVTVSVNDPLCNGSTGSFTLNGAGGTGELTYSNNGGTTFQGPGTFSGLTAGIYNWVVKDASGYTKTGQLTLVDPAGISAATNQTNPLCAGASNASFAITATGGTGMLSFSGNGGTSFQSTGNFTGLSAGSFNWIVKDANGCTVSGTVTIVDPAAISASATATNPSYFGATDGLFSITATGGTGTLVYSIDGGSTFGSSATFSNLACGNYNYIVKDANGCTKAGAVTLVCSTDITVTVSKTNPLCYAATNGSFTLTAIGGTGTFTYSKDGGTTFQSANTFSGLTAGTYNWVVKDGSGYIKSGQVTLTNPVVLAATSRMKNPTCFGSANGAITINATGGTGALNYSKDGGATYQSSNMLNGLAAGTYNWVAKDENGCSVSGQVILTNPPAITATATGVNPVGTQSNGSLTINASGGTGALTYSHNGGATFQSSNVFTGLRNGTYNWIVKDANGCLKTGQTILVCTCSGGKAAPAENVSLENNLSVYPNPASDMVNISFATAKTGKANINIYSVSGTLVATVYSSTTEAGKIYQKQVATAKLAPGVYMIQFQGTGFITTKKLIVLR